MTRTTSVRADLVPILFSAFRGHHQRIREVINRAPEDLLNERPTERGNSVAVIVTHMLASERETLMAVAGLAPARDRDSEFSPSAASRASLMSLVDEADDLLDELEPTITQDHLMASVDIPRFMARGLTPSGIERLIYSYGHAREHLGEINMIEAHQ